jgi:hypothetical protein
VEGMSDIEDAILNLAIFVGFYIVATAIYNRWLSRVSIVQKLVS